jgi:hypothetical protein
MTETRWLLDHPSMSPRIVPADHAGMYVDAPFTNRSDVHDVLFRFRMEVDYDHDRYGPREGQGYKSPSPAAHRQTADASALAVLSTSLLESPSLTTADLKARVPALELHHTGDLPARLTAYVARLDMPDYDPDEEDW